VTQVAKGQPTDINEDITEIRRSIFHIGSQI
jgi:hypothetical protein